MSNQELRPADPASHPPGAMDERGNANRMLRQRAEAIARAQEVRPSGRLESLSLEETQELLHELMVHHIELEMQNEELRRVQDQLDAARARYFDLYDLAPSGYFTLDGSDVIVEANLTLADLLGVPRGELIDRPIYRSIHRNDEDIFYLLKKQLAKTGETQSRDLRMVKGDGTPLRVNLVASLGSTPDGQSEVRCMVTRTSDLAGV